MDGIVTSNQPIARDQDSDFLATAHKRFRLAEEAESEIRREALDDLEFVSSDDQWPPEIKSQRDRDGRPCLTSNRLQQIIKQVINQARENRVAIQINPVEDADVEDAELRQGIIRHIEDSSNASVAYDTALEAAVRARFGYIKVVTEYADDESFNQDILIKRVRNPFMIYFDPACQEPDYSDANFAFEIVDYLPDDYKAEYPNSQIASLTEFTSVGNSMPGWLTEQSVRVAKYWHVERANTELLLLANGETIRSDDPRAQGLTDDLIKRRRKISERRVRCAIINAVEVLERYEYEGKWIPIVPVLGDEWDINGKRKLTGLVTFAKDPSRMYNYWTTAETEAIALAPKSPFIASDKQLEPYTQMWDQANVRNFPYLVYKSGTGDNPPQRNAVEPPIQAMAIARAQASDDLKATTGIFDASLGASGNETSGKGILARQKQGDVANFNYTDNLSRALKQVGRICLDLIPKIMDAPRVLRIVGGDEQATQVAVFNSQRTGADPRMIEAQMQGRVKKVFDLSAGKYDVTVSTGPSYATKRIEAVQSMAQILQAYPQLMEVGGDILVKNMDWPGAQELAQRMKKRLPPDLQDNEQGQPIPPQVQAQMAQSQKMIEMLTQQLNAATETINTKQMELESKERIAALQAQVELIKVEAQLNSKEAQALLQAEMQGIKAQLDVMMQGQAMEAQQAQVSQDPSAAAPEIA